MMPTQVFEFHPSDYLAAPHYRLGFYTIRMTDGRGSSFLSLILQFIHSEARRDARGDARGSKKVGWSVRAKKNKKMARDAFSSLTVTSSRQMALDDSPLTRSDPRTSLGPDPVYTYRYYGTYVQCTVFRVLADNPEVPRFSKIQELLQTNFISTVKPRSCCGRHHSSTTRTAPPPPPLLLLLDVT